MIIIKYISFRNLFNIIPYDPNFSFYRKEKFYSMDYKQIQDTKILALGEYIALG